MERKFGLFFLFTFLIFPVCELLAQAYYPIIAAKGRSGLIRTPVDRVFRVGEEYEVVRPSEDYSWRVAVVRVVLVEKKYVGLKIVRPINDTRIRKHDLLKVPDVSFEEKLEALEKKTTLVEPDKSASPRNHDTPSDLANKESPPVAPYPVRPQPSSDPGTAADGSSWTTRTLKPVIRYNRPFIGPTVSVFFPINQLGNEFQVGPQFGLQLMTPLHRNTFARFGFAWSPLRSTAGAAALRSAYLLTLTGTAMPHLSDQVFLEVGAGFYRQVVEQSLLGTTTFSVTNSLALLGGAGFRFRLMETGHLLFSALGNIYFPGDTYRIFFSFSAGWYFGF